MIWESSNRLDNEQMGPLSDASLDKLQLTTDRNLYISDQQLTVLYKSEHTSIGRFQDAIRNSLSFEN